MNMRLSAFVVLALGCCGFGQSAQAALQGHDIDQENSAVVFKVKHRGISYVIGRFTGISGSVSMDRPTKPTTLEFDVEVKPTSIDTNSKKRDRELRGKKCFDTSRHRKITFKSKACKQLEEDGKYEITGDLTAMGKTQELTVVFHLIGAMRERDTRNRIGGEATFTIKRSDFGLTHMSDTFADEVTVTVNLEAVSKAVPIG